MSTTQKLELSREIRQWIGTAVTIGSTAIFAWMVISPESFNETVSKLKNKFRRSR